MDPNSLGPGWLGGESKEPPDLTFSEPMLSVRLLRRSSLNFHGQHFHFQFSKDEIIRL